MLQNLCLVKAGTSIMSDYTPQLFALRQMLYRMLPLAAALLAFFLIYLLVGEMFSAIVLILATGGITLMYMGWFLSAWSKGLIDTPRRQWHVAFDNGMIKINAAWGATQIPLGAISSLTLVCDDNWDLIKGLEDQCLKLTLAKGWPIIIPGSAGNFEATLEAIKQHRQVEILLVN